jgi:hypothetical protein
MRQGINSHSCLSMAVAHGGRRQRKVFSLDQSLVVTAPVAEPQRGPSGNRAAWWPHPGNVAWQRLCGWSQR